MTVPLLDVPEHVSSCPTWQAAVYYLNRGWVPVPLWPLQPGGCACNNPDCKSPGKHPTVRWQGLDRRQVTVEWLVNCWRGWTQKAIEPGVGVLTEPSGIVGIDIDPARSGWATWSGLVEQYGDPGMTTRLHQTGGGGWHLLFAQPSGVVIRVQSRCTRSRR